MTRRTSLAALAAVVLVGAAAARAEEPQFRAEVSASEIALDDTVQLTISLTRDARQPYLGYSRPELRDFDVLHQSESESTQWMVVGSSQTVRTTEHHVYLLRPKHKGACAIPPAVAKVSGRELKTAQLVVRVGGPRRASQGPPPSGVIPPSSLPGVPVPTEMRGDEDVFIEARVDRSQVYLGEPVTVSWYLYSQADILRYRTTVEPKHDDFWSEDVYTPQGTLAWDRAEVHGRPYSVALLLKRALFPLKAGKLTVTPLEAEATTMQTAFYASASAVKGSKPITIDVLPLPGAGRPDGFEPTNVGRFDVGATVDKTEVKAGDALTLKVTIRGEGNIRNVKLRRLDGIDGFRVYEPTTTEKVDKGDPTSGVVRGERTYTYLLLPERGGDLTVPPVALAYFDPYEKRYYYSRTAPIPVKVIGDPQKLAAAQQAASKENVLGPKLRPLRAVHRVSSRLGERILRGPLLAVALAAPPGLVFLLLVGDAIRVGLSRDTAGRRRRRARAQARARMRQAEQHIKAQRPSAFFSECARAIYEHLEYRLGVKCEALTLVELKRLLDERGVDEELATQIVGELESCDFARFAPSASGPGEMRAAIRRLRALLGAIEKARFVSAGGPGKEAA